MASHFFMPARHASQYILPKMLTKIYTMINTIPLLNVMNTLTVQSVKNEDFQYHMREHWQGEMLANDHKFAKV